MPTHRPVDVTLCVSALTSAAGQPEQAVSLLDVREPLRTEGLCCEALLSCWLTLFLPNFNQLCSFHILILKLSPLCPQNEVPEGVRAAHHSKVSPPANLGGSEFRV